MARSKYPIIISVVIIIIIVIIIMVNMVIKGEGVDKMVRCRMKYGLCPAARCVANPTNDNQAYCFCDVVEGDNYSLGNDSCKKISPYRTVYNNDIIYSDFSPIIEEEGYHMVRCPSEAVNLNCMNKICTVYPEDPSKAICVCEKTDNKGKEWVTFNKDGEAKRCNYQSGASVDDYKKIKRFIESGEKR